MILGQSSGIFRNSGRYFTIFSFIAAIIAFSTGNVRGQDELTIFERWKEFDNVSNALYHEIANEAYRHLDKRERKLADIQTSGQYRDYVRTIKSSLDAAFGPMPEKTPLNARVTGTFEHEDILVEKIIYESRPGCWVTGSVFKLKNSTGRLPAILYLTIRRFNGRAGSRLGNMSPWLHCICPLFKFIS